MGSMEKKVRSFTFRSLKRGGRLGGVVVKRGSTVFQFVT